MRSLPARLILRSTLALALGACAAPGGTSEASVTSVSIDGGGRTIVVGDVLTLTATVVTTGGASGAVTWESSDDSVAVIDGVGTVTGLAAGATSLTATSTIDSSRSDAVTLIVDPLGALAWTRQFGTGNEDRAYDVATDADGNVYVTGYTYGALGGINAGRADAFVRSYESGGDLLWTRQFGTDSLDQAFGVATDGNANVYVAGGTLGALEGANAGGFDAFVRSFDREGVLRWTRQFGTDRDDVANGVAADVNGNVYVTGYTIGALEGPRAGGIDVFLRSFDRDGVLRWGRQFGTSDFDWAEGVATDSSGNVYVAGRTHGDLAGPSAGGMDAFVRSYAGDGTLRWTRQFGTSSTDRALSVATAANGNVYVVGYTYGDLEGPNAGGRDAFVRSFDGDGTLRWTRQFGTSDNDDATGVATDAYGNVYVSGVTWGALEGDNAGQVDAFVRSYAGDGTVRWTRQFGTDRRDTATGVATDVSGGVYVSGRTQGALEGSGIGGLDAFIRKYGR